MWTINGAVDFVLLNLSLKMSIKWSLQTGLKMSSYLCIITYMIWQSPGLPTVERIRN